MIIRRIRNEEYKRIGQLMALAFEFPTDNDKPADEIAREAVSSPRSKLDECPDCTWAAFEDDDSTMMSSVCSIPFTSRFDGHDVRMFGIGGVNTLPMYRRNGCVRAIFERALPAMYSDGGVFSYLYPFSYAYYRKFGYERGCERRAWTVKLDAIPKWSLGGYTRLAEAGADFQDDARRIYTAWADKYNMMTREENAYDFLWIKELNPFKTREYTYVYYSACGEPKGYVSFKPQADKPGNPLDCIRLQFSDKEGFKGILSLLKGFASDHECAVFRLPTDIDWQTLMPETNFGNLKSATESFGMVRAVNVAEALRLAAARGEGALVLDISDGHIPENNGRYDVRFSGGRVTEASRTERAPDLRMGVCDFSSLIMGRHDVDALEYMEDTELLCAPERAAGLFFKKPSYINKGF